MYVVLALIGTCSRKQYPNEKDNEAYKKWLEEYYTPLCQKKHSGMFIPSDTIYQLRCTILHESTTDLKLKGNNTISHIIITTTGSHFNFPRTNGYEEIQINAKLFILELLEAIETGMVYAKESGIDIGIDKGKIEIAKEMLKQGSDIEFIVSVTKLDRKEIEFNI